MTKKIIWLTPDKLVDLYPVNHGRRAGMSTEAFYWTQSDSDKMDVAPGMKLMSSMGDGTGCLCENTCCDEPNIIPEDHECDPYDCETCYCLECLNCGDRCGCNI